jgi:pimeloyl-ACP methyl ester carboxylesterase
MLDVPVYPDAEPAARQYDFDARGQRLRLYEWGDPDGRPVVLCHGYWDNAHGFDLLAPYLAEHYRVIALDTRGHGESAWGDGYSLCHMVADVVYVLEHVAGTQPAHLIGHSYGGSMACYATWLAPQLVDKLVDIEGFGPGTAEHPLPGDVARIENGSLTALRVYLDQRRQSHGFEQWHAYGQLDDLVRRRKRVNPRLSDAWLRYFCWHASRHSADGWRWKCDPELGSGAVPYQTEWYARPLQYLKRPMLAVIADEPDSWGPLAPELLDRRLSLVPQLERAKVPGTGHFPHMEKPQPTAALLLDYLQA